MPKLSYSQLYKKAVNHIMTSKSVSHALFEPYLKHLSKCSKTCGKGLRILILNAPCNGFGDLIFALKLSDYLKEWYGADVTLATTLEKGLLGLGANPKYVAGLEGGKSMQCRRFAKLKLNKNLPEQDLIFVAPIQIDFDFDLKDVKKIIPYANEFNTFSFSEYNDSLRKNFTFHTGVGQDRAGILLTKPPKTTGKPAGLKNPYAVVYVAGTLGGVDKCMLSFVEMIAKKYYKKHRKLDVVVPPWFVNEDLDKSIQKRITKFYPNVYIVQKDKPSIIISEGHPQDKVSNTLTFRCDILPVPNKLMMHLMKNSIDDILLTGDQSITDALSCCSKKNIFYQIAPWKSDLAKYLAKEMPNTYLKKVSTSCGTLQAISYHSNYGAFVKKWDFRRRAKPVLDAIVLSIIALQKSPEIAELAQLIIKTPNLRSLRNKLKKDVITSPMHKRSKRRRSVKLSKKKCPHGVKKDGDCKKKPGPKK